MLRPCQKKFYLEALWWAGTTMRSFRIIPYGIGAMDQRLRALAVLEVTSLGPAPKSVSSQTPVTPAPGDPMPLVSWHLHSHAQTDTPADT